MTCDHCGKEKPCIVDKRAEVTICADCRAGIEVEDKMWQREKIILSLCEFYDIRPSESRAFIKSLESSLRQKVEGEGG